MNTWKSADCNAEPVCRLGPDRAPSVRRSGLRSGFGGIVRIGDVSADFIDQGPQRFRVCGEWSMAEMQDYPVGFQVAERGMYLDGGEHTRARLVREHSLHGNPSEVVSYFLPLCWAEPLALAVAYMSEPCRLGSSSTVVEFDSSGDKGRAYAVNPVDHGSVGHS
ncbi:hypothetical protein [Streptomyces chartreusis]|uniref:hypothetical protein n=1 Tax=Streptomyces chartreusis TaxID=1969 RepID=UPI0036B183E0